MQRILTCIFQNRKIAEQMTSRFDHKSTKKFIRCQTGALCFFFLASPFTLRFFNIAETMSVEILRCHLKRYTHIHMHKPKAKQMVENCPEALGTDVCRKRKSTPHRRKCCYEISAVNVADSVSFRSITVIESFWWFAFGSGTG